MLRLAVSGEGAAAQAVLATIEASAGLVAAQAAEAEAIVAAGDSAEETLALAQSALASGLPTLSLALPPDLGALDDLVGLATRHNAALSLPNPLRYLPATIALHGTLQRGETGALLSAFLTWRISAPNRDPLTALGPAALDLLAWLVPGTITNVQATTAPLFGDRRDTALLLLRDESGLVRTVELLTGLPPTLEGDEELLIEVFGEDAALRAEPFNQAITIATGSTRRRQPWGTEALSPLLATFAAALIAGNPPPGSPEALRPILALLATLPATA